jgi:hypothetical protein
MGDRKTSHNSQKRHDFCYSNTQSKEIASGSCIMRLTGTKEILWYKMLFLPPPKAIKFVHCTDLCLLGNWSESRVLTRLLLVCFVVYLTTPSQLRRYCSVESEDDSEW